MKKLLLAASLMAALPVFSQQYAVSLNGSSGFIDVPDNNAIDLNSSFTLEAWIFPTGNGSQPSEGGMIFNKENSYELARFANGVLHYAVSANGNGTDWFWVSTGLVAPLNRWSHVALVKNGTNITFYLNAANSFTAAAPASLAANTSALRLGNRSNAAHYFQGFIDNPRVWNIALPQSSLKRTVFGLTDGPSSTGLVLEYSFPTNSGTSVANNGSNFSGLDGNLVGGISFVNSPILRSSNSLAMDGVDDVVTTPLSMNNYSAFTMEGWVNFRSTGGTQGMFGQNDLFEFGLYEGDLGIWVAAGVDNRRWDFTAMDIPVNTWHHYAVVGNGTDVLVYVDGVERIRAALSVSNYGSSGFFFNIGGAIWGPAGLHTNARFDEVRVWNIARTQTQIQDNRFEQIDPTTATGLVSYYQFNAGNPNGDNTGLIVAIDSKGNNNGTLNNMNLSSGILSNFTNNNPLSTLPVVWSSFTARTKKSDVELQWSTAQESMTRDFVVQNTKSPAVSNSWKSLHTTAAAGNSGSIQQYNYIHLSAGVGIHFYRILQRDLDGKETYSAIQSARIQSNGNAFKILMNPAQQSILMQVNEAGTVVVANNIGQIVLQQKVEPGNIRLSSSSLVPGTYYVRIGAQLEKIIVQ